MNQIYSSSPGALVEEAIQTEIQPWADWSGEVALGLASLMAVAFVVAFTLRLLTRS